MIKELFKEEVVEVLTINTPNNRCKDEVSSKGITGNYEARMHIYTAENKENEKENIENFFNFFDKNNKYFFAKENIIDYLNYFKFEFEYQVIQFYNNVSLEYWNSLMEKAESLDDYIEFNIDNHKYDNQRRYYIGSKDKIFSQFKGYILLPVISCIKIKKIEKDESTSFYFEINVDPNSKEKVEDIKKVIEKVEYINTKKKSKKDQEDKNEDVGYLDKNKKKLYNRIIYGAPGTGKSYKIKNDIKEAGLQKNQYKRVTFHPNYTYSKFVGAYKPVGQGEDIGYKFIGGPFLDVLIESLKDEKQQIPHVLVIEEINRANPAAVFGDVFQLLDRDSNGKSIYNIDMSDEMKNYVNNRLEEYGMEEISELYIPSNMYIWATMNSADQGVYPMDSAFKRRWSFEYIGIDENEERIKGNEYGIIELPTKELDSENNRIYKKYVWNDVRKAINNELKNSRINEDKLLGPFFLSEKELKESRENFDNIFKSKVLMYLYEDILKHKNIQFFKEDDERKVNTLCDIMRNYDLGKIFTFELNEYKEIEEVIENKGDEIKEPIGV
ncbi:AAA family ATPase [Clostridium perfringens]|nr:AAA family ATPase [Clostridium perfringens]